jgi:hypothetical protein
VAVCALTTAWNAERHDVPGETPTVLALPVCKRHVDIARETLEAETTKAVHCIPLKDLPDFMEMLAQEGGSASSDFRMV